MLLFINGTLLIDEHSAYKNAQNNFPVGVSTLFRLHMYVKKKFAFGTN